MRQPLTVKDATPLRGTTDLEAFEAGVLVEHLHLVGRKLTEHLLDGEQLVDFALARKQRLSVRQLAKDAADRPDVHCLAVRSSVSEETHSIYFYTIKDQCT